MTTALAPAACALVALMAKVQPPRLMSAMFPAGKPAKSAASQPGVGSAGGAASAVTAAVTSPLPEYSKMLLVSGPAGPGATCSSTVPDSVMKVWNWKSVTVTW